MTVSSPCIRQCCLNEKDICLGCFRSLQEILAWSSMSDSEKQHILKDATERKAQASPAFTNTIFDHPK
ncbi:MAG: DUF1289 domain-containing protein [Marinomonas sp.]|jgi:predicted Fe-S protein YdhL (DUF1289 family)|uniref:DUF1289 domain-containing protein n=1 Tax=Marinomonas sp. TaxID=1904862 RepID=UPI003C74E44B